MGVRRVGAGERVVLASWRPAWSGVWVLAGVLLWAAPVAGQAAARAVAGVEETGRVVGVVRSGQTGQPLVGARVEVTGRSRVVVTAGAGRFELTGLPEGEHEVEVSAPYYGVVRHRVAASADRAAWLEVVLPPEVVALPQIEVLGEVGHSLRRLPGSAAVVTEEELERSKPLTAGEVLRRVPGVVLRDDSGPMGLRTSIGIRGLNPDRSRKVLVLEDGVPVALAPYGEPEMYYSPAIERMSRVEVVKGSGSILFGPQTIGGVINYRTPDPPVASQGAAELVAGGYGLLLARGWYGGTVDNVGGRVNVLHKQGDGVRGIDFRLTDLTSKLTFELGARSRLGLKLGYYDETSASTYLGLTQPMYEEDRFQNPVPDDRLDVRRYSASVTHQQVLRGDAVLRTTAYAYTTTRNWRRQDFDRSDQGRAYVGIVGDAAVPGGAIYLRDGTGNRNRTFEIVGVEPRFQWNHAVGGVAGELDAGLRLHHERAHEQRIDGRRADARSGDLVEDEVRAGRALSAFVQNRFLLDPRLHVTAGTRLEWYEYDRDIRRRPVDGVPTDVAIRGGDGVLDVIPGLGLTLLPADRLSIFAGVHRGFAPPRVKDAITAAGQSQELDAERSWNYELGARTTVNDWIYGEATAFLLDFSNQIIPASESAGGQGTGLLNAGRTRHAGFETSLGVDVGRLLERRASMRMDGKYTYSRSRFASGAYDGNRLPYAPEHVLALGIGVAHPAGLEVRVDGTFIADQFADNLETVTASADGTVGLIPAHRVWDVTARYQIRPAGVEASASLKNALGARYIASRAPQGIQPGHPRQVTVGLRKSF